MAARIRVPAPSCASCRFFVLNPHPSVYGACRRHAPQPADGPVAKAAVWPSVEGTDFCGDYVLDHIRHREMTVGVSRA